MKPTSNKRHNEIRERVCALYAGGKSVKEIGRIIGRNHALVWKWVKQAGALRTKDQQSILRYGCTPSESVLKQAFESDYRGHSFGDQATHWANHPIAKLKASAEYSRAKSLAYYHKNKRAIYARHKANPQAVIKSRLRLRIWKVTRRGRKVKGIENLIGCQVPFFMQWIEQRFKSGMGWHNMELWQIDHVRPCSSFDLTTSQGQRDCFHYSNMQPLWETENKRKWAHWAPTPTPVNSILEI